MEELSVSDQASKVKISVTSRAFAALRGLDLAHRAPPSLAIHERRGSSCRRRERTDVRSGPRVPDRALIRGPELLSERAVPKPLLGQALELLLHRKHGEARMLDPDRDVSHVG